MPINDFEQLNCNKLFDGMYGLAVIMSISTPTTSKDIDKIHKITFICRTR